MRLHRIEEPKNRRRALGFQSQEGSNYTGCKAKRCEAAGMGVSAQDDPISPAD